jgi:hypothetical protein
MVKINQKVQVISISVIILITAISSGSFSSVYASSDNRKNDHDDDDLAMNFLMNLKS